MSRASPAVVLCGVLSLGLLRLAWACQDTAWSWGHLNTTTAIEGVTLAEGRGSSCACCAYCHTNPNCSSLSYNAVSRQCLLFDTVASYSTIIVDSSWMYYVMPGRSQHEQFCRTDADCQADGDFCRGRVCTDLNAITCRAIYEDLGAGDRLGSEKHMFGWIKGRETEMVCRMTADWPGFTRVLHNRNWSWAITRENVRSYSQFPAAITDIHSSLELANVIRQLGADNTQYELRAVASCYYTSASFDDELVTSALIDRSQPVLVEIATTTNITDTFTPDFAEIPSLALPYLLHTGEDIVSVKMNIALDDGTPQQVSLPLARTDGLLWFDTVTLFIREETEQQAETSTEPSTEASTESSTETSTESTTTGPSSEASTETSTESTTEPTTTQRTNQQSPGDSAVDSAQ